MISTNFFGAGAIELLRGEIMKKGFRKALVITDSFLFESKVADQICTELAGAGVHSFIYYGVKPNPTVEIVNEALSVAADIKPDFIVALGGGSAIDTCKAVGIGTGKRRKSRGLRRREQDIREIASGSRGKYYGRNRLRGDDLLCNNR